MYVIASSIRSRVGIELLLSSAVGKMTARVKIPDKVDRDEKISGNDFNNQLIVSMIL